LAIARRLFPHTMVKFRRMSTLDLERPLLSDGADERDEPTSALGSSLITSQLAAGSVLLLGGIIIYASGTIAWCDEVDECYNVASKVPSGYHIFGMFVIAPLLIAELINLAISYNEAHKPHVAMTSLPSRWQVSLMMCVAFSILLVTEGSCTTTQRLVYAVAQEGPMDPSRPVYTMRYIEWFVNVPLLLIMSGHFCLGRPMSEVLGPVVLTDVYIFLSWEAFVVKNLYLSRTLVVISFALYAWASYEMLVWASSFLHMVPGSFPAKRLRAAMVLGLVGIFGVYGVVNILAISGIIGASVEQLCYTIGDVGVKTTFCIGLTAIRTMDARHALAASFQHITRQSTVLTSLLRGTFDIVMECTLDSHGNCWLPSSESPDLRKLEHWLNRSAGGAALNHLLDGPDLKRFHSYVLGAVQRTDIDSVSEHGVPQVINCALSSISGQGVASRQTAVLHLSGVSSTSMADMADKGMTAFIAMCISPGAEEVPLAPEQVGIVKDWLPSQPSYNSRVISLGSLSMSSDPGSVLGGHARSEDVCSPRGSVSSRGSHARTKDPLEKRVSYGKYGTGQSMPMPTIDDDDELDSPTGTRNSPRRHGSGDTDLIDSFLQTNEKVGVAVTVRGPWSFSGFLFQTFPEGFSRYFSQTRFSRFVFNKKTCLLVEQ